MIPLIPGMIIMGVGTLVVLAYDMFIPTDKKYKLPLTKDPIPL